MGIEPDEKGHFKSYMTATSQRGYVAIHQTMAIADELGSMHRYVFEGASDKANDLRK